MILAALLIGLCFARNQNCGTFKSEQEAIGGNQIDYNTESCVLQSIDRGWFRLAEIQTKNCIKLECDLTDQIRVESAKTTTRIDKFIDLVEAGVKQRSLQPAMRWAQSPDNIYLDVKFSHRMDAAGCLDVSDDHVEFSDNIITIKGRCSISDLDFQVNTTLKLWQNVEKKKCSWSKQPGGRLLVTLVKKYAPNKWRQLLREKDANLSLVVWFDLQDTYEEELQKIERRTRGPKRP